jgi:hypothetical protein
MWQFSAAAYLEPQFFGCVFRPRGSLYGSLYSSLVQGLHTEYTGTCRNRSGEIPNPVNYDACPNVTTSLPSFASQSTVVILSVCFKTAARGRNFLFDPSQNPNNGFI